MSTEHYRQRSTATRMMGTFVLSQGRRWVSTEKRQAESASMSINQLSSKKRRVARAIV